MENYVIEIEKVIYRYEAFEALKGVSLSIRAGQIFGFLGPNGSGKTTLFRILATLLRPAEGSVRFFGKEMGANLNEIRRKIGVVFQSPSLDGKLTVQENLIHHGYFYGLSGSRLREKAVEMMRRLGLRDRAGDLVDKLSGGLKRRVEIAKGLMPGPEILILDEPSTGLDPGARRDLWTYLKQLRQESKITILVTTHLMDEAEHADQIAILNQGQIICVGEPLQLKSQISGDIILVRAAEPARLNEKIQAHFSVTPVLVNGVIQIEHAHGAGFVTKIIEAFPGEIESVTFRKPTLEDVYLHRTGHQFWAKEEIHAG